MSFSVGDMVVQGVSRYGCMCVSATDTVVTGYTAVNGPDHMAWYLMQSDPAKDAPQADKAKHGSSDGRW